MFHHRYRADDLCPCEEHPLQRIQGLVLGEAFDADHDYRSTPESLIVEEESQRVQFGSLGMLGVTCVQMPPRYQW